MPCSGIGGRAIDLIGGDQQFRGHAGNVGAFRIVQPDSEYDGSDITLASTDVALSSKIRFGLFQKHFSRDDGAAGQANSQSVSQADVCLLYTSPSPRDS